VNGVHPGAIHDYPRARPHTDFVPAAVPSLPLSRDRIVAAALSMTRNSGDPPSMRALAAELAVTPGALYRHLEGQHQLVTLMIDEVMEHVAMPDLADEPDPWKRIRYHVRSLMATLAGYPALDRLIARYGDTSEAARVRQRWVVRQLRIAGLSRGDAVRAYGALDIYWLGSRQRADRSESTFYFGLDRLLEGIREFAQST
jgi:AcrR family transcriptional regulator